MAAKSCSKLEIKSMPRKRLRKGATGNRCKARENVQTAHTAARKGADLDYESDWLTKKINRIVIGYTETITYKKTVTSSPRVQP